MPENEPPTRRIPEPIRRAVRQRCGYGCIFDGSLIVQYDHFDPEFAEMKAGDEHRAEGITLLCPSCHHQKTVGLLDKSVVSAQNNRPAALETGFSTFRLAPGADAPEVWVGSCISKFCPVVLRVQGTDLLTIAPPDEASGPYRVSGTFQDERGEITLKIVDNEVLAMTSNWDVEQRGRTITLRNGPGDITLRVHFELPHRIRIDRLNMWFDGSRVAIEPSGDVVYTFPGQKPARLAGSSVTGDGVCVEFNDGAIALGGRANESAEFGRVARRSTHPAENPSEEAALEPTDSIPDQFVNERIEIYELAKPAGVIEGITFRGCTLVGPVFGVLQQPRAIERCVFRSPNSIVPLSRLAVDTVYGAIAMSDCAFHRCQFEGLTLLVDDAIATTLLRQVTTDR